MGLLATSFRAEDAASRSPLSNYWYTDFPGLGTFSGVTIGVEASLGSSVVWAATRLLAESLAMLPLLVYARRDDGGKNRAPNHPLYDILHGQANRWQTSFAWKRMMMVHALLWGNAYSRIVPGPRGAVDQLIPLHPEGVRVERISGNWTYTSYAHGTYSAVYPRPTQTVRYRVLAADGRWETVNDEDIFHLPGISLDGVSGLCVMRYARESIALEVAAKRHAALAFGQGTRLSGILKVKGTLSRDAKDRLLDSWQEQKGGLNNHFKSAVLDESADWIQTGMNNEDAQLLQQLNWSVEDVARFFNVPLHMIQHTSKETSWGSGIEALGIGFVTYSLMPWLTNWEQTVAKDLITSADTYFVRFLLAALLRGSTKERYEAYQIAAGGQAPWITRNEVRILEDMNPLPGLDDPLRPLNMGPGGAVTGAALGEAATSNEYLRLFLRDAAGRVLRREMAAMSKLARRVGDDSAAWRREVESFYAEHLPVVMQTLRLGDEAARRFVAEQQASLVAHGPAAMDSWEPARIERLMNLAMEADGGG